MKTRIYKIKLRETFEGRELEQHTALLNDKIVRLGTLWTQDDNDPYPGESALGPVDLIGQMLFHVANITWLSSGDTETGKS